MSMIARTDEEGQRVMVGALLAYRGPEAAMSALLSGKALQKESNADVKRTEFFCTFWERVVGDSCTGTGRAGDTALLVLQFLRHQALLDSSSSLMSGNLARVIASLLAIAPHVSCESHPRLLMLCAWLARPNEPERVEEGRFEDCLDLVSVVRAHSLRRIHLVLAMLVKGYSLGLAYAASWREPLPRLPRNYLHGTSWQDSLKAVHSSLLGTIYMQAFCLDYEMKLKHPNPT